MLQVYLHFFLNVCIGNSIIFFNMPGGPGYHWYNTADLQGEQQLMEHSHSGSGQEEKEIWLIWTV
jgi:hypothetical protein